nr:Vacuolar protein sorting-associated protein [Ipomoea batatas]
MGYRWYDIVLAMAWASRWRKAYKCKRVIIRLKQRIAVQKSRMDAIIRQARCDVAQLLQNGQLQLALSKVEQLHSDQCRLAAYNQLLQFCDCILTNLSGFSMNSKFSDEGREAASSIIYASARCSELPELQSLRDLFKHHFGKSFERTNVQLLPGNTVNSQTKHNLTRKPAMEDIKLQLTDEIANEYSITLGPQFKLLARESYIASCELKKKDEEPEGGLRMNERKHKSSSRTLKLQDILQKIRSNTTLTSSKSAAEKDFYPSSRGNNNIDPLSFKISSNNASVSIQGKGIVPEERAEEVHHVEDPCSCSEQHSSSKRYPDKVIDQRHNHMFNKDASYARKERNEEVQDSHIIDEDQKNRVVTHVHPKLPDYDRLAARFEDLKRQNAKDQQPLTKWMR